MSENKKTEYLGELISEEQLDAVSGGVYGDISNPIHSLTCWFRPDGGPREDGRTKCMSECKGNFSIEDGKPVGASEPGDWIICCCWGTDKCVGEWHKPCRKPPRTVW